MVPVINKIDLPSADPDNVVQEIEEIIGIEAHDALLVSAKTGEGVPELLEALVRRIPAPRGDPQAPLQALIIDSWFDNYVGVVSLVRVMNGALKVGDKIRVMSTGRSHPVDRARPAHAEVRDVRVAERRRGRIRHRRYQGDRWRAGRRHDYAREQTEPDRAAWLQADQAARIRGPVPGQF